MTGGRARDTPPSSCWLACRLVRGGTRLLSICFDYPIMWKNVFLVPVGLQFSFRRFTFSRRCSRLLARYPTTAAVDAAAAAAAEHDDDDEDDKHRRDDDGDASFRVVCR